MSADQTIDDEWFEVCAEELAFLADVRPGVPSPLEQLTPIAAWLRSVKARAEGARRLGTREPELADVDQRTWEVILRLAAIVGNHDEASLVVADGPEDEGVNLVTCTSRLGRAQLAVTPTGSALRPIPDQVDVDELAASLAEIFPARQAPALTALRLRRGGAVEGIRWDGAVLSRRSDTGVGSTVRSIREDALVALAAFVAGAPPGAGVG